MDDDFVPLAPRSTRINGAERFGSTPWLLTPAAGSVVRMLLCCVVGAVIGFHLDYQTESAPALSAPPVAEATHVRDASASEDHGLGDTAPLDLAAMATACVRACLVPAGPGEACLRCCYEDERGTFVAWPPEVTTKAGN